jgi:hypothetical protein
MGLMGLKKSYKSHSPGGSYVKGSQAGFGAEAYARPTIT